MRENPAYPKALYTDFYYTFTEKYNSPRLPSLSLSLSFALYPYNLSSYLPLSSVPLSLPLLLKDPAAAAAAA